MKQFKRFCWMVAWSGWLSLGVGLYRELPRAAASTGSVIPINPGEQCEFLRDTSLVAVTSAFDPFKVRVFQSESGEFVRDVSLVDHWPNLRLRTLRMHGVLFADGKSEDSRGLWVVDPVCGKWKRLSNMTAVNPAVHPSKPWIAFRESAAPVDKPRSLVVVDWTTGAEVFARPLDAEYVHIGEPIFLGDSDRLLVSVTRSSANAQSEPTPDLEVWRMSEPGRLEKVVRAPTLHWRPDVATASRIAWRTPGPETMYVDVFDVDAERVIFSLPPWDQRLTSGLVHSRDEGFLFSKSGRAVLCGVPVGVWNVDTGAKMWERSDGVPYPLANDNAFGVLESRDVTWMPLALRRWLLRSTTIAVYDLETARLNLRCWYEGSAGALNLSSDRLLGINNRGVVHRLPHLVNWPLLAFCQAILALPLVVLWALLRWRSRRAARR